MSWTEDNNITTTWYEDRFHSGEAKKFNDIEKLFNIIEYKFNEIDPLVTLSEDAYVSVSSWVSLPRVPGSFSEDASPSMTLLWSED